MALAHIVRIEYILRSLITRIVTSDALCQIAHSSVECVYVIPQIIAIDLRPNIKDSSGTISKKLAKSFESLSTIVGITPVSHYNVELAVDFAETFEVLAISRIPRMNVLLADKSTVFNH